MTRVIVLFLDGVGLGADDDAVNPLAIASTPVLIRLLHGRRLLANTGIVQATLASMAPTDASLGMAGRPQSASGQSALLTGINVPALLGEHYGPRPDSRLRSLLEGDTLFTRALAAGRTACLVNAFPQGYFDAVARGKRLHGAIPYAAQAAGLRLCTAADLAAGRALSVDLTNAAWRNGLGYPEMPLLTPWDAGKVMAHLANEHDLTFFDHWATDVAGHRGDLATAVRLLEEFDAFLAGLLQNIELDSSLVVITSDHGNLEDCGQRRHTENPVPTIAIGAGHAGITSHITDLTHITPAILNALG